jgi:hypothetical protein
MAANTRYEERSSGTPGSRPQLRHREGRPVVQHNSDTLRNVPLYVGTFALLAQPPFHHTAACPTRPSGERADAAIKRSKTRASRATGGRTPRFSRNERSVGLGFPTMGGESPQKIWVVGCEASRSKEHATHDIGFKLSTIYTYTLQDFLYFNDEPCLQRWNDRDAELNSHAPGWKTGLASSMCPKCPGHSDIDSPQV